MDKDDAHIAPAIERLGNYLMQPITGCELCESPGGETLWEDDFCRIVLVTDVDYPGFCRVILREHVREMTDLPVAAQTRLMRTVLATESAVRNTYRPDKINLASFGNVVPHLHWHVIPRWHDDRHFPQPIWGTPQRVSSPTHPPISSHHLAEAIAAGLAANMTSGDSK